MPKLSSGILLYRVNAESVLEVLVVHPGGPFWAKKDDGAWSIPKGEYEPEDDPHAAALREFEEELGTAPPEEKDIELGEVKQSSGKRLVVWAHTGDFDVSKLVSNTFELEWPPKSGKLTRYPEVDRAEWFPVAKARQKLLKGQIEFLDRLITRLEEQKVQISEGSAPPEQASLF